MHWGIHSVDVQADEGITYEEAPCHVMDELVRWQACNKTVGKMIIHVDGEEIEIQAKEISAIDNFTITRIHRLTRCCVCSEKDEILF